MVLNKTWSINEAGFEPTRLKKNFILFYSYLILNENKITSYLSDASTHMLLQSWNYKKVVREVNRDETRLKDVYWSEVALNEFYLTFQFQMSLLRYKNKATSNNIVIINFMYIMLMFFKTYEGDLCIYFLQSAKSVYRTL